MLPDGIWETCVSIWLVLPFLYCNTGVSFRDCLGRFAVLESEASHPKVMLGFKSGQFTDPAGRKKQGGLLCMLSLALFWCFSLFTS